MSSPPEKFSPLELVPGGAREEVARQLANASNGELSADALEALAVDTPLLPPREPLGVRLANYFGRHQLLLFALSFFCLWAILILPSVGRSPGLMPGQTAPRDFVAPQTTFLSDRTETDKRREEAAALVTPVYNPDRNARDQALAELPDVIQSARVALRSLPVATPALPASAAPRQAPALVSTPASPSPDAVFAKRAGWRVTPAS